MSFAAVDHVNILCVAWTWTVWNPGQGALAEQRPQSVQHRGRGSFVISVIPGKYFLPLLFDSLSSFPLLTCGPVTLSLKLYGFAVCVVFSIPGSSTLPACWFLTRRCRACIRPRCPSVVQSVGGVGFTDTDRPPNRVHGLELRGEGSEWTGCLKTHNTLIKWWCSHTVPWIWEGITVIGCCGRVSTGPLSFTLGSYLPFPFVWYIRLYLFHERIRFGKISLKVSL